jgi:hypothetical protein
VAGRENGIVWRVLAREKGAEQTALGENLKVLSENWLCVRQTLGETQ